ncbi:hypothetical protein M5689_019595 [Euphorbia peplus]|nr:hypothetical protein M5689_019595 [Euphorbia peplus]
MLKACVSLLCQNQGSHKESSKGKEEVGGGLVSLSFLSQSKEFCVRIVHAGGREELYQHAVPASHVMDKYPGMCVARPEVFKNPQKSVLRPDEDLLPGHKYLILPSTTARKLKRKQIERRKAMGRDNGRDEASDVNITWDLSKESSDVSVSSAKDFYNSKSKLSRDSKRSVRRGVRAKKAFVPPLPKTRTFRAPNWEPSLTSVQEVSP